MSKNSIVSLIHHSSFIAINVIMPKSLFLNPERADADGLVGVGGDLSPTRLLEAYPRGIFPWFDETTPILWWSPDPRAIFELDGFHVSRRLARTLRSGRFTTRSTRPSAGDPRLRRPARPGYLDHAGNDRGVHDAAPPRLGAQRRGVERRRAGGRRLRRGGRRPVRRRVDVHAHPRRLQGGAGAARATAAERGFQLFDVQYLNDHTARLGAVEIRRREYLARLRSALACKVEFV